VTPASVLLRRLDQQASDAPWSAEEPSRWQDIGVCVVRGANGTRGDAYLTAALRNALPALAAAIEAAERVDETATRNSPDLHLSAVFALRAALSELREALNG